MRALLVSVGVLIGAVCVQAQGIFGNEKEAYVLMPAEPIAAGKVVEAKISPSGRLIFYKQIVANTIESLFNDRYVPEIQWHVYDRRSGSHQVLKLPEVAGNFAGMGDDATILFNANDPNFGSAFVNIATGSVTPTGVEGHNLTYDGRYAGAGFLLWYRGNRELVCTVPNGRTTAFGPGSGTQFDRSLGVEGNNIIFRASIDPKVMKKPWDSRKALLNPQTMTFTYSNFKPDEEELLRAFEDGELSKFETGHKGGFNLISLGARSRQIPLFGVNGTPPPVTVKPVPPKAAKNYPLSTIIGPAGGILVFSVQNEVVIYQDAGALLLREIKPADPSAAEKLAERQTQKLLVSRAKDVALGMFMCAADDDDKFPGQNGWEPKLEPYVKDKEYLHDFNYTFKGGSADGIKDPHNVEMGFFVGSGGRAVAYMDGSCRWVPNP